MLRSQPRPFYVSAQPVRHGELMMRMRARRMGFVVAMLATIIAAPFVMMIGAFVF